MMISLWLSATCAEYYCDGYDMRNTYTYIVKDQYFLGVPKKFYRKMNSIICSYQIDSKGPSVRTEG